MISEWVMSEVVPSKPQWSRTAGRYTLVITKQQREAPFDDAYKAAVWVDGINGPGLRHVEHVFGLEEAKRVALLQLPELLQLALAGAEVLEQP